MVFDTSSIISTRYDLCEQSIKSYLTESSLGLITLGESEGVCPTT